MKIDVYKHKNKEEHKLLIVQENSDVPANLSQQYSQLILSSAVEIIDYFHDGEYCETVTTGINANGYFIHDTSCKVVVGKERTLDFTP